MKYLGGKSRIAKQLASYLNQYIIDNSITNYIEPFCGAAWVTQEIACNTRVAMDIHPDLIMMWKELQRGWVPPEVVSEQEYAELKKQESSALRGFVGFGSSFSGKWFGGYARSKTSDRNYTKEAKNTLLKKISKLQDVHFANRSYDTIPIESISNRLIYCDCPYIGTTGYSCGKFDHNAFYAWCRAAAKNNHVFISEYTMPDDFETVLTIQTKTDMSNAAGQKEVRIEKLFKARAS